MRIIVKLMHSDFNIIYITLRVSIRELEIKLSFIIRDYLKIMDIMHPYKLYM